MNRFYVDRERYELRAKSPILIGHDSRNRLALLQIAILGMALWGVNRDDPTPQERAAILMRLFPGVDGQQS
jgi:hypothetical protein